jgi:hypothetical protein
MSGPCNQCVHFRRVKPISQVFAGALNTNDAPVSDALAKIVEDERKRREAEAQYKTVASSLGRDYWEGRPLMSDFCGLKEHEEQYFIAEIKNAGARCGDFTPGERPRHRCVDCLHRVVPQGRDEDRLVEQAATELAANNIALGLATSLPDALLSSHREGVPARVAFEASGAYSANGHLSITPRYLDSCGHYSTNGDHVICLMQNLHDSCPAWQPVETTRPVAGPGPTAQSTDGPTTVLHPGPPSLTRVSLDDTVALIEYFLDARVPDPLRARLQQAIIDDWNSLDGRAKWQQGAAFYQELRAADPERRIWLRESNQPAYVAALRSSGSPVDQQLVALYDRANPGLAAGPPPLTSEVADAVLAMEEFQRAAVGGGDPLLASDMGRVAQRGDEARPNLIANYDHLSQEARDSIAMMPWVLAQMRMEWPHMSEQQREAWRQQWAQEQDVAGAAVATPPRPAARPAGARDELVGNILRTQEESEEQVAAINPVLAAQMRMMNMQERAQLLSNLARARHETSMAIINNIGR